MILQPDKRTKVVKGLKSPFKNVRLWALKKVAIGKISTAVPHLIDLLNSPDQDVSVQAAFALEELSTLSKPQRTVGEAVTAPSGGFKPSALPTYQDKNKSRQGRSLFAELDEREDSFLRDIAVYIGDTGPIRFVGLTFVLFLGLYGYSVYTGGDVPSHGGQAVSKNSGSSGLVFEDVRSSRSQDSSGMPTASPAQSSRLPKKTYRVPAAASRGQVPALPDDHSSQEIWLSVAKRYLKSGRPRECVKYCNMLIERNLLVTEALKLKTVARERYGVID